MGTKNNPGNYDCYANAEPDEPMFVLLARDVRAPYVVEAWCALAEMKGSDPKKIAEARRCADEMRIWRVTQNTGEPERRCVKCGAYRLEADSAHPGVCVGPGTEESPAAPHDCDGVRFCATCNVRL